MQRKAISKRRAIITVLLGAVLTLSEMGISFAYAFAQNRDHKIADLTSASSVNAILQKAEKLFDQGRYQDALAQYQQALNIYRQQGDRLGEAISLTWIGAVQIGLRQEKQALNTLLEANLILQKGWQNATNSDKQLYRKAEGENQYQSGRAYLNLEEYAKGLKMLENSLAIRKEVGDRYREGKTLTAIAIYHVKKFDFSKALEFLEKALQINQSEKNQAAEAQNLFYLASVYGLLDQKDKALALVQQSAIAYQSLDNLLGQANVLNLEANILSLSLNYTKVVQLNLKALELARQSGDRILEADQLNAVAVSYRNLNEYPKALEFLLQAEKVYRDLGDRAGEARNLKNIAEIRLAQGQNREALALYSQAKTIYQDLTNVPNPKLSDQQTLASILVDEGSLYTLLSQYPKAISTLQAARSLSQSLGDKLGEGIAAMYLAGVYLQLGEPAKVIEILKLLPSLTKNSPQLQQMAQILLTMFSNNPDSSNPQNQLSSALSLLEFFKQSGNRATEAAMLSQIGALYFELKQPDNAIASHQQALKIYRAIGDVSGVGNAFYNLGLVYALSNQSDKAFTAFQTALQFARQVGNRNQESKLIGNLGLLVQSQYPELAIAFYKQSVNVTESIRKELRVLDIAQQKSYQQTVAANYRVLADLLLQKGRVMEALGTGQLRCERSKAA